MNQPLHKIEQEWRTANKQNLLIVLATFPDAEEVILKQLAHYKIRLSLLENSIVARRNALSNSGYTAFERWLVEYLINFYLGTELHQVEKHIARLNRCLAILHPSLTAPAMLSEESIQQAKEVPIESLVDQRLRIVGQRLYGLCPLHHEKTSSFVVYKATNTAWCFGCQQGGDTIKLTQLLHGYSFKEAVKYLNNY